MLALGQDDVLMQSRFTEAPGQTLVGGFGIKQQVNTALMRRLTQFIEYCRLIEQVNLVPKAVTLAMPGVYRQAKTPEPFDALPDNRTAYAQARRQTTARMILIIQKTV